MLRLPDPLCFTHAAFADRGGDGVGADFQSHGLWKLFDAILCPSGQPLQRPRRLGSQNPSQHKVAAAVGGAAGSEVPHAA